MRRFSFYHPLWLSFFSKELYQEVGRRWSGVGFAYLLFLLAVAWAPLVVKMHLGISRYMNQLVSREAAQFPRISITNGEVNVEPPGPHRIKDPDSGKDFIVIDTELGGEAIDAIEGPAFIVTRNKLIAKQPQRNETRIWDLSGVKSFQMSGEDLQRWLRFLGNWMAALLFPLILLGSFVYRIVQALLYAAIGTAFAKGAPVALSYETLLRLAAVAVTPAVLVDTLKDVAGVQIPFWWFLCFLISMFYLHFAVKANAEPETLAAPPGMPPSPIG